MVRRMTLVIGSVLAASATLVVVGFRWWPASLIALLPVLSLYREVGAGVLLDPYPHRKGRRGELAVATVLAGLDPRYRVHHGIDTGHGDIDHLVIGPTGIFVIETKNLDGRFALTHGHLTRNGYDATHLAAQATAESMAVKDMLPEARRGAWWVEAVVAVSGDVEGGPLAVSHATVVAIRDLVTFITGRRIRLSDEDVEEVESCLPVTTMTRHMPSWARSDRWHR